MEEKLVESYRRKAGVRYQLPKLSEEKRDVVISAIVPTASQRKVVEEFGIEKIYNRAGIVFNSGFDANSSIIETFYNKDTLIISDRLNHASIYDGIVNCGAKLLRYKHLDMENLENILIKYRDKYEDILVVSETVYSMDGDVADIKKLV